MDWRVYVRLAAHPDIEWEEGAYLRDLRGLGVGGVGHIEGSGS